MTYNIKRRYPIGAEIISGQGVHFRIWAPDHSKVALVLENEEGHTKPHRMHKEKNGYFSILIKQAAHGTLYRYILGNSDTKLADPASRFQPQGPHGPSCVIDPYFPWTDKKWPGIAIEGQIIYEMHIGTFTMEGTFHAAMHQLENLAQLGITVLEIMPLNEFPGHFGWGYDGVNLFSPTHLYGTPEDVKSFIDKAHKLGLAVILDVVYNHLGPEGNQMIHFAKDYLSDRYDTEWGRTINFDLSSSREFFTTNARYWIEEYHFDGLRLDATWWMLSSTPLHILAELSQVVKVAGKQKRTILIGENEKQDTNFLRPYDGNGYGLDALWNDDFHHNAIVRLLGKREAYYIDFLGSPQEFISSIKYGFLYQGQYCNWYKKPRGTAHFNLPPSSMVIFLENHDHVANSGQGKRIHQVSDLGNYKALTCLLLLSPNTPMLFQGQEFGSTHPFYYFADHNEHLNKLVYKGRKELLAKFPRLATKEAEKLVPDPANPWTFTQCKLDFKEREKNVHIYKLHKDLIKLRKREPHFAHTQSLKIDGAVLGDDSFLIRYFGKENGDLMILINFGPDYDFNPAPEPLLVAGQGLDWEGIWSSESPEYGGEGTPPINDPFWKIPGHSALVLKTKKVNIPKKAKKKS